MKYDKPPVTSMYHLQSLALAPSSIRGPSMMGSVVGPNLQPVQGVPCPFSLSRRASEEGKQCDVLPLVSARLTGVRTPQVTISSGGWTEYNGWMSSGHNAQGSEMKCSGLVEVLCYSPLMDWRPSKCMHHCHAARTTDVIAFG